MKHKKYYIVLCLIGLLLVSCGKEKQDEFHYKTVTEVDTLHTSVAYTNDYVDVIKIELHANEQIPAHSGKSRLVYSINDYTIKLTKGEESTSNDWKAGDIHWHDKAPHAIENVGKTTAEFLIITRTDAPLLVFDTLEQISDLAKINEEVAQLLFENEMLEVIRINLAAGEEIAPHFNNNHLMLSESDINLELVGESNEKVSLTMKNGNFRWFLPGNYSQKNIGEDSAQFLIISFK